MGATSIRGAVKIARGVTQKFAGGASAVQKVPETVQNKFRPTVLRALQLVHCPILMIATSTGGAVEIPHRVKNDATHRHIAIRAVEREGMENLLRPASTRYGGEFIHQAGGRAVFGTVKISRRIGAQAGVRSAAVVLTTIVEAEQYRFLLCTCGSCRGQSGKQRREGQ